MDIDKTLKTSMIILFSAMVFSSVLVIFYLGGIDVPLANFGTPSSISKKAEVLEIPFRSEKTVIPLPLPRLDESICFSYERARPGTEEESSGFILRLKRVNQVRRITLPARVDFKFDRELQFANQNSSFWAEVQKDGADIIARFLIDRGDQIEEIGLYRFIAEESNIRNAVEFSDGSPMRILAEAKVLGRDLFLKNYGEEAPPQRIDVRNRILSIKEGDYLVWKENQWQKVISLSEIESHPLANVRVAEDKSVVFDTWGGDGYARIGVSAVQQNPFKTKNDDFLTSVRIRSEKQISCMLDKQCFVLKVGDWVLKEDLRWKILRKSEEKEAFLQGKLEGELFVFDRIDSKGGQKNIHGHLVNVDRSQMVPVNVFAQSQKKTVSTKEKGKVK